MNIEQVPKPYNVDADPALKWGRKADMARQASETSSASVRRDIDDGMYAEEFCSNTGSPAQRWRREMPQPAAREGRSRAEWDGG
jgi:hypothetical protein